MKSRTISLIRAKMQSKSQRAATRTIQIGACVCVFCPRPRVMALMCSGKSLKVSSRSMLLCVLGSEIRSGRFHSQSSQVRGRQVLE